jgi:hypothetical protein
LKRNILKQYTAATNFRELWIGPAMGKNFQFWTWILRYDRVEGSGFTGLRDYRDDEFA